MGKANTTPSVDSVKVRIPIDEVEILNPILKEHIVNVPMSLDSGQLFVDEIDETEFKDNSYQITDRGIKTRYLIQTQNRGGVKSGTFLVFLLTAKQTQTKEGYWEGITERTIGGVYNYLMSQEVVKFSMDSLLSAKCTDIDIKRDFDSTEVEFGELTKRLQGHTHCTTDLGRGQERVFNLDKKENGIWWATRRTRTPRTNPYVKLYSKHFDLVNQMSKDRVQFTDKILGGDEGKDIFRIETTIKNKDHLDSLGISDNSLRGILSLSEDTLANVIGSNLKRHIEPRTIDIDRTPSEGISPKDLETINLINMGLALGQSYQSVRRIALVDIEGANLSKRGKNLDRLYHTHIKGSKSDINSQRMESIFDLIGW